MNKTIKSNGQDGSPIFSSNQFGVVDLNPDFTQRALYNILDDMLVDKKNLEKQRVAIFNILEDVNETGEDLKRSYQELEVAQNLTRELGFSLELSTVVKNIAKAIWKLFPKLIIAYVVAPFEGSKAANPIYILTPATVGEKQMEGIKKSILSALAAMPRFKKNEQDLKKWLERDFSFEIVSGNKDSSLETVDEFHLNIPISVSPAASQVLSGIINLSSPKSATLNKKELDMVYTLVESASQMVDRLRTLIASEHSRLRDLVKSMSNGVVMFDRNREIIVANPVARKICGLKEQNLSVDSFLKIFSGGGVKSEPGIDGVGIEMAIDKALSEGKSIHYPEITLGTRFFEIFILPVRDFQGNVSAGAMILHDISYRKEIEKMKDEFLNVAAHDLRTPSAAIRGFISRVLDGDAGDISDKAKELLSYAYEGNNRLIHLVDDFLIVSRLERGKIKIDPKPGDLEKCVETVVNELSGLAKQEDLILEYKKIKLPQVMIDNERIIQVLTNLVGNAIKFTEKGKILITHEVANDQAITKVTDTGIGIPKETQKHLFKKFFKGGVTEVAQSGLGLGLYISRLIIEGHEGKVWVESKEGKGSTFLFSLSVAK